MNIKYSCACQNKGKQIEMTENLIKYYKNIFSSKEEKKNKKNE